MEDASPGRQDMRKTVQEEIEVHQKHLQLLHDHVAALRTEASKVREEVVELRSLCARSEVAVASWRMDIEAQLGDLQAAGARAEVDIQRFTCKGEFNPLFDTFKQEIRAELAQEQSSLRLELERREGRAEQQVGELSVAIWQLGSRLESSLPETAQDVVASRQRLLEERLNAFEDLVESEIEDRAKEYRRLWNALGERSGERALQEPLPRHEPGQRWAPPPVPGSADARDTAAGGEERGWLSPPGQLPPAQAPARAPPQELPLGQGWPPPQGQSTLAPARAAPAEQPLGRSWPSPEGQPPPAPTPEQPPGRGWTPPQGQPTAAMAPAPAAPKEQPGRGWSPPEGQPPVAQAPTWAPPQTQPLGRGWPPPPPAQAPAWGRPDEQPPGRGWRTPTRAPASAPSQGGGPTPGERLQPPGRDWLPSQGQPPRAAFGASPTAQAAPDAGRSPRAQPRARQPGGIETVFERLGAIRDGATSRRELAEGLAEGSDIRAL